jgi:hypothetical protein
MEISFMSARFKWNADGGNGGQWERKKCSTIKITLNEDENNPIVIHDRIGLSNANRTGFEETEDLVQDNVYDEGWCKARGPIMLQEHDNRVQFYGIHIDPTWNGGTDWQRSENCLGWPPPS